MDRIAGTEGRTEADVGTGATAAWMTMPVGGHGALLILILGDRGRERAYGRSGCSRCETRGSCVTDVRASDRVKEGWHWAFCGCHPRQEMRATVRDLRKVTSRVPGALDELASGSRDKRSKCNLTMARFSELGLQGWIRSEYTLSFFSLTPSLLSYLPQLISPKFIETKMNQ